MFSYICFLIVTQERIRTQKYKMANSGYLDNMHIKQIPVITVNNSICPTECRLCTGDIVTTYTDNVQSSYDISSYICRVTGLTDGTNNQLPRYWEIANNDSYSGSAEISQQRAYDLFTTGAIEYFYNTQSSSITTCTPPGDTPPVTPPVTIPPVTATTQCVTQLQRTLNLFKFN